MYCSSDGDPKAVYFSEIFQAAIPPDPPHSTGGPSVAFMYKVGASFITFLKGKYSFTSNSNYPSQCPRFGGGAAGLSAAQSSKQQLETQYKQQKMQVVETGWKNPS